jgi:hypothetical protein
MIRNSIANAIVALCLTGPAIITPALIAASIPALADETAPDSAGGRFMFEKQADGQESSYLRLDTQTGEVSLCSRRAVGFACVASPEDRTVLENEIARLRAENAALKKDILSRGLPLPPGVIAEPQSSPNGVTLQLPSDADIDRMVAYADRLWHRFVDAIERAQKQVLNKS